MPSQQTRDGSDRRQRRRSILFNLNAAAMYQLLSVFVFYLLFATLDAVIAADNQPDGGGNNGVNDGFTAGPEAITTTFGEYCHFFILYLGLFFCTTMSNVEVSYKACS